MYGITDDTLITQFDNLGRDHDATLIIKVLRICRQANLKLNKDKCLFQCTSIPFFAEIMLQSRVSSHPRDVQALIAMPPHKC